MQSEVGAEERGCCRMRDRALREETSALEGGHPGGRGSVRETPPRAYAERASTEKEALIGPFPSLALGSEWWSPFSVLNKTPRPGLCDMQHFYGIGVCESSLNQAEFCMHTGPGRAQEGTRRCRTSSQLASASHSLIYCVLWCCTFSDSTPPPTSSSRPPPHRNRVLTTTKFLEVFLSIVSMWHLAIK